MNNLYSVEVRVVARDPWEGQLGETRYEETFYPFVVAKDLNSAMEFGCKVATRRAINDADERVSPSLRRHWFTPIVEGCTLSERDVAVDPSRFAAIEVTD